ncbi:MAG: ATP-binding protein [Wenzhouxiangella sp.]|jgi:signal transduction histidine kinase|nr:ATP-binding protein [Wenzhouxiangella sp.]
MGLYRFNWARVRRWTITIVALGCGLSVATAANYPVFRHLGMLEGLPNPEVEAIVQDSWGYVWIGTRAGLIRHEGDQLTLLPRNPSDPGALPDNNVMALHAHSDGMVWAALKDSGVVEIGPDLAIRRHLKPESDGGRLPNANIWSMVEDCDGRLWLGFVQGGVGLYDPALDTFRLYPQDDSGGLRSEGFLTYLLMDPRCRVWAVQTTRLSVFDPAGHDDRFVPVLEAQSDSREVFFHAWISPQGELFLSRFNDLIRLGDIDADAALMSPEVIHSASGFIVGFGDLPDGRVFVATRNGLEFPDAESAPGRRVQAYSALPNSLPGSSLSAAHLVDAEGGLWLAVSREGLAYLPPSHSAFSRYPRSNSDLQPLGLERIQSVTPGLSGASVWVVGDRRPFRLDFEKNRRTAIDQLYPGSELALAFESQLRAILETEAELLVLQYPSLVRLDKENGEIETLVDALEPQGNPFYFIDRYSDDRYWLGTRGGELMLYDLGKRSWTLYGSDQPPPRRLTETSSLIMRTGPDGKPWLAGAETIYRYEGTEGFRARLELRDGPIRSLAWDGPILWVGTDQVLYQYRLAGNHLSQVRSLDLSAVTERTTLLEILPSRDGLRELWLVLRSGLARLDLDSGLFRAYSRDDGLALSEFSRHAIVVRDDGSIVLGGSQGIVTIDPSRLRQAPFESPVYLRALSAGDRRISLAPGTRPPVDLNWQQNSVRFEFSALTYVAPERVRYRVRLDGWDDDWLTLGRQSTMYYSNLRPGKYRFEVQASTPDGRWGSRSDDLAIRIAPPPWASPYAGLAYALLTLALAGLAWRQINRARRRRRELQDVLQKRQLAEGQRQLIQRLNSDLEPLPLARCIAGEIQRLTAAKSAILGYNHQLMPAELVSGDNGACMSRSQWLQRLDDADGVREQAVDLKAEDGTIARVLLVAASHGFEADLDRRLALLVEVAGQSLHNSVLLQKVRLLAEDAEQASRAKSEFLATMSHEIRTPLHGVLGMAELLHESAADGLRQDLLKTLRTSGRQLQRIIDDVLDISRIEAGRLELLNEVFETVPLLEQVVDLHAPAAASRGLGLRLRTSARFPLLAFGDAGRLAQILGNLLSNAVKFTADGAVEVTAEVAADGQLLFSVSDTGPGIAPDQIERLFQPFSQLDSSMTRVHSGSGLGLAICRRLTEGMGGQLTVRPRRGPGSCFELCLPAGGPFPAPLLTSLLAETRLVALVDAATYRVLLRLARRWGFGLENGRRLEPQAGRVVLFDGRCPERRSSAERWSQAGCALLELSATFHGDRFGADAGRSSTVLRWPLVESRLLAALFDRLV